MSAPPLPPPLVALTPATLRGAHEAPALCAAVEAAFEAGLRGLLLRAPELPDGAYFELARELGARARAAGAWFAVHDRVHAALALEADGVHLGFRSLMPAHVRRLVGELVTIGASAHAGDEPTQHAGADYLFVGPVRDTPSKRGLKSPLGCDGLAGLARELHAPVWAIGGMRPEDVAPAFAAGARGVAVLSGIFGDADPARRTSEYLAACEVVGGA